MSLLRTPLVSGTLILFAVAAMSACSEEPNTYQKPPPRTVTVATPIVQKVTDYLEFTGNTVAYREAEVRARVSGILQSMEFTPGTKVEKGQLLFVIDPSEYEANLKAAEAELASAKAKLEGADSEIAGAKAGLESAQAEFKRASTELKRAQTLLSKNAGSEAQVVQWQGETSLAEAGISKAQAQIKIATASKTSAQAAIQRAEAQVARAQLDLGYTKVTAPITGRAGRNLVDVGNLVGRDQATVLTEITRSDPIYAYFALNEQDLLKLIARYRSFIKKKGIDPDVDSGREAEMPMEVGLRTEEGYPHKGVFDYGASSLETGTATIELRGVLDNPGKPSVFVPGMFVKLRIPLFEERELPLVTERAILFGQGGSYVYVVDEQSKVVRRNVTLGRKMDGLRVIETGVGAKDRIIVAGTQRARSGAEVKTEDTDMASLKASALAKSDAASKDGDAK